MNAILFSLIAFSLAGAVTYAIGHFVTLRLAIIFWLALCIFGVSLLVMPIDMIESEASDGDVSALGHALFIGLLIVPACIGSTIGVIAAWFVKRMRETAV